MSRLQTGLFFNFGAYLWLICNPIVSDCNRPFLQFRIIMNWVANNYDKIREILSRSWIFAYFNLYLQQNDIVNERRGFFWQFLTKNFYRYSTEPSVNH